MVLQDHDERTRFIIVMKNKNIHPVFHYISLHEREFYNNKYDGDALPNSDRITECLVSLPLYYNLNTDTLADMIIQNN